VVRLDDRRAWRPRRRGPRAFRDRWKLRAQQARSARENGCPCCGRERSPRPVPAPGARGQIVRGSELARAGILPLRRPGLRRPGLDPARIGHPSLASGISWAKMARMHWDTQSSGCASRKGCSRVERTWRSCQEKVGEYALRAPQGPSQDRKQFPARAASPSFPLPGVRGWDRGQATTLARFLNARGTPKDRLDKKTARIRGRLRLRARTPETGT